MVNVASTTERGFDASFEPLKLVFRHKRQRCAGKATAVDVDGTFTAKQLLAERDGKRHILLFDVARRGHVLQQDP